MKAAQVLGGSGQILGSPVEAFTRNVFTRVVTALARTMRDEELTVAQIAVLHLLDQGGGARLSALAEALSFSASATSRLVADLVRRGLLTRREEAQDRRAKVVDLSARGRRLVDRISEDRVRVMLSDTLPPLLQKAVLEAARQIREQASGR